MRVVETCFNVSTQCAEFCFGSCAYLQRKAGELIPRIAKTVTVSGVTVGDTWIAGSALWLLAGPAKIDDAVTVADL